MTYVDLRPTGDVRDIEVLVDGQCIGGELEPYRQDRDGTWRAWVRWSTGVEQNHLDWVRQDN